MLQHKGRRPIALVTGGASGLGKATVDMLLAHEYRVAIMDLAASNGAVLAKSYGDEERCIFTPADVTSESDVTAAFNKIKERFSNIDVCITCAGIVHEGLTYDSKKDIMHNMKEFNHVMQVNVSGTFNVIRHAIQLMSKNGMNEMGERGVIINTSSVMAYDGHIKSVAYSTSQGALVSMILPLARETARDGIRVMGIAAALFDTPFVKTITPEALEETRKTIPFPKRSGHPKEFAGLVLHIIRNQYLNGAVIRLDGALRV